MCIRMPLRNGSRWEDAVHLTHTIVLMRAHMAFLRALMPEALKVIVLRDIHRKLLLVRGASATTSSAATAISFLREAFAGLTS
jgi:hypothetical protein